MSEYEERDDEKTSRVRPTTPPPLPFVEWADGVTEEDAQIITELLKGEGIVMVIDADLLPQYGRKSK